MLAFIDETWIKTGAVGSETGRKYGGAMTRSDEIELKLVLNRKDARLLETSHLLTGDRTTQRQRSIYFDTPDHRLARAGLTLRIRRAGGRRIQTVKARDAGSAGLFVRPEWERAVPDDRPVIDDTTPLRALLDKSVADLAPLFEIHVERRAWSIREDAAIIDVVIDRGMAVTADRQSPFCEMELELKGGDATALFAFARKLDAAIPVRLGTLTKAERGYALIDAAVTAFKAEPVVLDHDMTTADAFQHVVRNCLRQFRQNEDLLLAGGSPEAIHQARVALRRLRSAFSVFAAIVDDDVSGRLRDEVRWLATELGDARNLDVLSERALPAVIRDRLETARRAAYARVDEVLASPRSRRLMLDLAQWIESGAWLAAADTREVRRQPARELAGAALDRFRRKVKKDGRHVAEVDDQARHKVRRDAKKLRYAADFFASLFEGKHARRRHTRFVVTLEALQDQLGALNDLATAPHLLSRLGLMDERDATTLFDPDSKQALLDTAEEAYHAFVDAKRFWR